MPAKEDLMSLTRRSFVKTAGLSSAALLALQKGAFAQGPAPAPGAPALPPPRLLLHNNENPLGPGEAVLNAVRPRSRTADPPAATRSRTPTRPSRRSPTASAASPRTS